MTTHLQSGPAWPPPEPRPSLVVQSEYPPIHFDPLRSQDPIQWRHQNHTDQCSQDREQAILQILVNSTDQISNYGFYFHVSQRLQAKTTSSRYFTRWTVGQVVLLPQGTTSSAAAAPLKINMEGHFVPSNEARNWAVTLSFSLPLVLTTRSPVPFRASVVLATGSTLCGDWSKLHMWYRQDLDRHLAGPGGPLSIERLNNFWVAAQRKNFFDTQSPHLLPSIW